MGGFWGLASSIRTGHCSRLKIRWTLDWAFSWPVGLLMYLVELHFFLVTPLSQLHASVEYSPFPVDGTNSSWTSCPRVGWYTIRAVPQKPVANGGQSDMNVKVDGIEGLAVLSLPGKRLDLSWPLCSLLLWRWQEYTCYARSTLIVCAW